MIIKYNDFLYEKLSDKLSGFNEEQLKQQFENDKISISKYINICKENNLSIPTNEYILNVLKKKDPNEILEISIKNNFLYGVKYALEKNAVIDKSMFIYICYNEFIEIIKYLNENNLINIHDNDDYMIITASRDNKIDIINYIINDDQNINENAKISVISNLILKNNLDMIKYLISEKHFKIYERFLYLALDNNKYKILFYLIDKYDNELFYENHFKYKSVKKNKYKVVEYLLKTNKVDVDKYMYDDAKNEKMKNLLKQYDKEI